MKHLLLTVAILLLPALCEADERLDKLTILTVLATIDYTQSAEIFYHRTGYAELNPILGKQPSRSDMITFGVVSIGLLALLPDKPWARVLIDSAITSEYWNVEDNRAVLSGQGRRINAIPIIVTFRF